MLASTSKSIHQCRRDFNHGQLLERRFGPRTARERQIVKSRGHRNHATWSVVQWLAKDESRYLAARDLAATDPTGRQVADFVFTSMPRGTPGMDGPEDYLTVDWASVREAVCGD